MAEGDLPAGTACDEIAAYVASIQHGMSIHARDGASRQTLMAIADCCAAGWDAMVEASSTKAYSAARQV
ncbi:hypothetical protein D3C87_2115150 [compost metagenome]